MLGIIRAILWKDLKIELRTKEVFTSSFIFAIIVLVIFNFTLDLGAGDSLKFGAGFLWIAFAFAGVLALNRSFTIEKEDNCAQALMLTPADRGAIYLGKFFANVIFMLVTEIFVLPLFVIFFNVSISSESVILLLLIFVLGSIGFSSVGTVFAAVAANTRMRDVMLPVLLLPVTVPVLIASVETTAYALGAVESASFWFKLLVAYDIVFVTASFLVFEHVLEE
jgi:heme exporter protein B